MKFTLAVLACLALPQIATACLCPIVMRRWTADSAMEVQLRAFSPAMAQIVADLQKSTAQGHLCSSVFRGQTILTMGDPRTIVSWRFYSLRNGDDRLETDKGEVLEMTPSEWGLTADNKAVSSGKVETSKVTSPQ